jgi:serine/threonine protein kinase/formylglycine-generating enzyme required for sulfatase activity
MSLSQSCLPPGKLRELIDGRVEEPQLSLLTEHLEQCVQCQLQAKTLFSSDTLVETLRSTEASSDAINALVPHQLIAALKMIPNCDSAAKLSADGLSRDQNLSPDDLGFGFLQPAEQADEIGRLGHYRILQVLGRGGMGAVFLAEDPKLGRKVALKVMLPKIASIPAARDRFLREAKAAASLKNDHIVTVYQVDEFNGVPFLAMELLQGESLEDALRVKRRFSISETIQIARDVARGLADAHEKGLVHRDIKPGNLWLEQTPDGATRVKILDFGLARAEVEDINITEFGTIVGTPAFMAPEQARADRPIDSRADLFSLGCVLYVLCTGEIPFKADTTVGVLMALALNTPAAPSQRNESVPVELSRLTMQLLEKDPAKRPQSARDVVERLRQIERNVAPATTAATTAVNGTLTGMSGKTLLGVSRANTAATEPSPEPSAEPAPELATKPARGMIGRGLQIATAFVIAALMFIAGEVFLWQTPDGKVVRIESNDPSIMLAFGNGELKVTGAYEQPVTLTAGKVDLKITRPQPDGTNFEFETDKLVVRKGDQIMLKVEVLDGEVRIVQEGHGVIDSRPLRSSAEVFAALISEMCRANPGFDGAMVPAFANDFLVGLDLRTDNVTDIGPLRELKHLRNLRLVGKYSLDSGISDLTPLQGLPLTSLQIYNSPRVTDLSPLKGMLLQELRVDGCSVADFSPIAGMPVSILMAWSWAGSDLSPLKGMPLKELNIGGNGKTIDLTPLAGAPLEYLCVNSTNVSDLSPLKGMPLTVLLCENTLVSDLTPLRDAKLIEFAGDTSRITDLSVLQGMPIGRFFCDVIAQRELKFLRECRTLTSINFRPAVDVLREHSEDLGTRPVSPAFTNNIGLEFMQVPKGKAWLIRRESEERPMEKHETVFEQDFYLGAYEVTQEQWTKVMGTNPSWFTRNADGANEVKTLPDEILKRLPVERVSWLDCQEFLKRLNEIDQQPGWTYRLPTEAEWQYACRGGPMQDSSEAEFEFYAPSPGQELSGNHANFARDSGWNRPCRVGLFAPNKLGLYDMHGNVAEWCDDKAKWLNTESRLLHAGGWNDSAAGCRTSRIEAPTEQWTYYDLGFRVARVPAKP